MLNALARNPQQSPLFTDLYELTMAQAYDAEGFDQPSVFELSYRTMPPQRNYLISAGLDDVLTILEGFQFPSEDLAYLEELDRFSSRFLDRLAKLRFTGDVHAVPEGTAVFPHEPFVQVIAPLIEAQLVETILLNQIHFQTLVASKAARIVTAAAGRMVVDFGSRRAPGAEAALRVARAGYLVGADGTSLVLAGKQYGIPVFGTMAHSYIQAHDNEAAAFSAFARQFPETTLLVDTYNTLDGVRKVIDLSRQLGAEFRVRAIRLDSGNLEQLAKESRRMLDAAGLQGVKIFLSSELDEHRIAALLAAGAPIDGFGVGTKLAVADDASHFDLVYKLVEYAGRGRTKRSSSKILYPGRKQVCREFAHGKMLRDWIGRFDEQLPGERLLVPVMRAGQRLPAGRVSLDIGRQHAMTEINKRLPENLRQLTVSEPYPVTISEQLRRDYEAFNY